MPHLKRVAILHCEIFGVIPMVQLFAQPCNHYKRWIPSSKFDFEFSILKCIANLGIEARSMNCRSMLQAMTGSCGTSLSGSCIGASGLPFVRSRSTSNCSGVSQCFGSPSNTIAVHQSQQTAVTTTSSLIDQCNDCVYVFRLQKHTFAVRRCYEVLYVLPSFCLSVRPSHSRALSKRLNVIAIITTLFTVCSLHHPSLCITKSQWNSYEKSLVGALKTWQYIGRKDWTDGHCHSIYRASIATRDKNSWFWINILLFVKDSDVLCLWNVTTKSLQCSIVPMTLSDLWRSFQLLKTPP